MINICRDAEKVKHFMLLPEIYRYAAEYGVDKSSIEFTKKDDEFWAVYDNGEDAGIIKVEVKTGICCEFHPYILKRHKRDFLVMVKEFFLWFFSVMPAHVVKLNSSIVSIHKSTISMAKAIGMTHEGTDRKSHLTKYGAKDRVLFGITRDEVLSWAA